MSLKIEPVPFLGSVYFLPTASNFSYYGMTYEADGIDVFGLPVTRVFRHVPANRLEPARWQCMAVKAGC